VDCTYVKWLELVLLYFDFIFTVCLYLTLWGEGCPAEMNSFCSSEMNSAIKLHRPL
jgi:hypothetical protein